MTHSFAMLIGTTGTLPVQTSNDVAACRRAIGQLTDLLEFSIIGKTMFVTAASEIARNVIRHGGGGSARWTVLDRNGNPGVRVLFKDAGPGIPNLTLAMTDGWSTSRGLGLGLSGARRLVHEFDITSTPGFGTEVVIVRWRRIPRI